MKLFQECFFLLRCIGVVDRSCESLDVCFSVMKLGCYHFSGGPVGVYLNGFLVPGKGYASRVALGIYCDHFVLSPVTLDYCLSLVPRAFCFLQH